MMLVTVDGSLMIAVTQEVRARGAHTIIVTDNEKIAEHIADDVILIPENGPLTALLGVVPLQQLACKFAERPSRATRRLSVFPGQMSWLFNEVLTRTSRRTWPRRSLLIRDAAGNWSLHRRMLIQHSVKRDDACVCLPRRQD